MDRRTLIVALVAVEIVIVVAAAQAIRGGGTSWDASDVPAPVTTTLTSTAGAGRVAAISLPGAVVSIAPSTDGRVHVTARTQVHHWGWSSARHTLPIHVESTGEGVRVWRDPAPSTVTMGWTFLSDTIDVSVPATMAVDVSAATRIVASGMRAALRLHSNHGSVRVSDQDGDLTISSDNGRVYLDRVSANAISIHTAYGRIVTHELAFSGSAPRLDASTEDGRLELGVKQLAADGRYVCHTQNGPVRLQLPAGTDATVTMKTADGKISASGVSLSGVGDERRAILGDGRAPFDVSTQNGSIALTTGSTE